MTKNFIADIIANEYVRFFLGLLIGKDTCDTTPLISFFQAFRFITSALI